MKGATFSILMFTPRPPLCSRILLGASTLPRTFASLAWQHFANLAPQFPRREGLPNQRYILIQHVRPDERAAVPGHVEHLRFWMHRTNFLGQGRTVHAGHHDVS